MIKRIEMERRYDGTFPPNRFRYLCDSGHRHPSRVHAGKCNDRRHSASVRAADRMRARVKAGAALEVGDDGTDAADLANRHVPNAMGARRAIALARSGRRKALPRGLGS